MNNRRSNDNDKNKLLYDPNQREQRRLGAFSNVENEDYDEDVNEEENEELDKNKDEDEGDSVEFVEETVSIQIESETSEEKLNEEQLQNNQENIENENDEIDENGL